MKKAELFERLDRVGMRSEHGMKYKVLFSEDNFVGTNFITVLLVDKHMEVKRFDYINKELHLCNNATVYEVKRMGKLFKEEEE